MHNSKLTRLRAPLKLKTGFLSRRQKLYHTQQVMCVIGLLLWLTYICITMNPLYIKAIHIIGVVTWFAGLFYLVRLFIYHAEAEERPESEKKILQTQYLLMERRLWSIITNPSMYITVATGLYLAYLYGFFAAPWMHLKLGLVLLLLVYHFACLALLGQYQRGEVRYSSQQLRVWNEVATLLLIGIVFVVVLKTMLSVVWGVLGLLIIGVVLMVLIKLYKFYRTHKPGQ